MASAALHLALCFGPHQIGPSRERPMKQPPPAARLQRFPLRSASFTGSGAEYSEQLLTTQKKKRRMIAGVDQEELLEPALLADPDSFFCDLNGVQIHHKICHDEKSVDRSDQLAVSSQLPTSETRKLGIPMILLHGFGASVFSWSKVMRPLADMVGSKVLAFDRPAFGLTSRTSFFAYSSSGKGDATPINPYSMAFSVLATHSFIDSLGAEKAILMGHSAGCFVAANAYFEAPERIAALILVAPAIVAPFFKGNKSGKETQRESNYNGSPVSKNPVDRIWNILLHLFMGITSRVVLCFKVMKQIVHSIYKRILSTFLRSAIAVILVRTIMDKFGILGVRNAFCDAKQLTDHVIQGYTKPLRAKGWEMALLEYTLALLTDSASESKPSLSERLCQISCPVLIITGDTDRVVPSWNARRLASAIPGSSFEMINNCGHMPHEEKPEEFLHVVNNFLRRTLGISEGTSFVSVQKT